MKVPSRPNYLLPALFIVAVVLLLVPANALMSGTANKAPAVALQSNPGQVGKWNTTLIQFKTVPLHISLLPNGKILYWGRDKVTNGANLEDVTGHSNTYVVDPQFFFNDPLGHTTTYFNSTTNLFCSGHSFLPDGRLLVTGGHEKASVSPFTEGLGDKSVNLFDYNNTTSPWSRLATGLSLGRWYPYNVTLENGNVAILGGSYWTNRSTPGAQPLTDKNPNPEKYIFDPNGQGSVAVLQQDQNPYGAPDVYPLLHLVADGRVLVMQNTSRLFDANDPSLVGHFTGYPPAFQFSGPAPGQSQYNPSSAMLDANNGKVLVMGGALSFGGDSVNGAVMANTSTYESWQFAGTMAYKRKFHTATVLPDGKVLVTGGTQCPGGNNVDCPGGAVLTPELWSQSSPSVWTQMATSPSGIPRVYHSIALLLPDATVLVGGSGLPGALGEPGAGTDPTSPQFRGYGHPDGEIYSPPYLFDALGNPAVRPVITSLPTNKVSLNKTLSVGFTSSTAITSAVLIRLGSVTHGNNQDQRRIPLNFTVSGSTLNLTMPATGRVCPPGPYMLFILNSNGTPSVAKIITVTTANNAASPANGAFATASSTVNANFPASAAINGDRTGQSWGTPSGGWNDGSQGDYSQDWVRVDFNGAKTINAIDVYTLRDGYATKTNDPDILETFNTALNTGQGATSYDVQYLSGSGWITIDCGVPSNPCGRVVNNNKVRRLFSFPAVTTSAVRVAVHGSVPFSFANNYSRLVEIEALSNITGANLALGKPATQSSTLYTSAAAAVDGNTNGNFANASVTHTSNTFQPWWQVDLGASQSLQTIRLWNRTDCCGDRLSNFYVLVSDQPFVSTDLNTTINQAGVSNYFTAGQAGVTTTINVGRTGRYVRVQLAGTNFLSLAEVEVIGSGTLNVARATNGGVATASSTFSASYPASAVIDGDRQGRNWGNGGGWNDATEGQFGSDWLQVNFAGTKVINEIDVFTLRDGFASKFDPPTLAETFNTALNSGSGITSFSVQYWTGSSWVEIPNGYVGFNNKVWRQFLFSPISTSAIRVMVRDAAVWTSIANNYSRIVEVEAWGP
jgi:hypothetical protein